ncbi:sugar phosphate nucleotidyltransferase [Niallia sp. MER TA 168]|uniref:sugar phosphate nucleotidyltransferase n=1 Tax=Niallia sp. MER TA 168 TaxID=2939568 RepID=UPI00203BEB08|nr:sugar phosphate nucleotidyltransferase [Niallia sp. MER TA 168]MCM3363559.1 sugar phosphate nucleotidyltransferase [Niallia sp. MER TA 168]
MKLILLSGGSGKRLWPLSNDARSKQFLRVLEDENNTLCSMVQRVYGQLTKMNLNESTVIATSKSQVEMLKSQLDLDIPLIVEPTRRDTFPAIALAAVYLYSEQNANLNEVIGVLPVDPYVEDDFFHRITELEELLKETKADLALMGVRPTYPSSKYGYIVPKNKNYNENYIEVEYFTEKPTEENAEHLIKQSALWNCGVFAFTLEYIISKVKALGLPLKYSELFSQFNELPKSSFDYEVVENAKNIVALPYGGYWKDLGTWNTLTEEMSTNQIGKGVISDDCENVHLINELDLPVTMLGVSNLIVSASPDGILVSDKDASPRIKELVGEFDNRPMFEERRWGWYKVLDYTKFEEGIETLTKRICIKRGKNLSYQQHFYRSEVWTVIRGHGEFVINDDLFQVKAGDVLQVPIAAKHAIKAITDLEIIEVQSGSQLIEEDITRLETVWESIINYCKAKN